MLNGFIRYFNPIKPFIIFPIPPNLSANVPLGSVKEENPSRTLLVNPAAQPNIFLKTKCVFLRNSDNFSVLAGSPTHSSNSFVIANLSMAAKNCPIGLKNFSIQLRPPLATFKDFLVNLGFRFAAFLFSIASSAA